MPRRPEKPVIHRRFLQSKQFQITVVIGRTIPWDYKQQFWIPFRIQQTRLADDAEVSFIL